MVLLWGAINGFIKGFLNQCLTLVALLLGVWGGIHFSYLVNHYLSTHYSLNGRLVPAISFLIIFILILIIIHFIGLLITAIVHKSVLGQMNRIAGILFGILKMAFILSIIILILEKLDPRRNFLTYNDTDKSYLYKPVQKIAPAIFPHIHLEEIKNGLIKGTR